LSLRSPLIWRAKRERADDWLRLCIVLTNCVQHFLEEVRIDPQQSKRNAVEAKTSFVGCLIDEIQQA
jgi:hypothetical protein